MKSKLRGMEENKCTNSELEVTLNARRSPRFKAGSDLSSRVNLVAIDFNEEMDETSESVELKIRLSSEACVPVTSGEE